MATYAALADALLGNDVRPFAQYEPPADMTPRYWYSSVFSTGHHDLAKILLTTAVCTQEGEKIALSRRVDKHWRLIGWGQIRRGTKVDITDDDGVQAQAADVPNLASEPDTPTEGPTEDAADEEE